MIICTYAALSTIVTGVIVGLFALNEGIPQSNRLGEMSSSCGTQQGAVVCQSPRAVRHAQASGPTVAHSAAPYRIHPVYATRFLRLELIAALHPRGYRLTHAQDTGRGAQAVQGFEGSSLKKAQVSSLFSDGYISSC